MNTIEYIPTNLSELLRKRSHKNVITALHPVVFFPQIISGGQVDYYLIPIVLFYTFMFSFFRKYFLTDIVGTFIYTKNSYPVLNIERMDINNKKECVIIRTEYFYLKTLLCIYFMFVRNFMYTFGFLCILTIFFVIQQQKIYLKKK